MSGMNLFTWIRDGVRQSVLLGVSDAIEHLGTPANADELHPSVAGFLQVDNRPTHTASPRLTNTGGSVQAKNRKRLGKSLKEIGTNPGSSVSS
jgi:hypothetical protein